MAKQTLRVEHHTRKEIVSATDMTSGKFYRLANARLINHAVVRSLKERLEQGLTIEQPIVINRVDGQDRVIDGNHRICAVEAYLTDHPMNKVELPFAIYEDLDEDEEKALFKEWNSGRKQNTNDVVQQYWNEIPLAKTFAGMKMPRPVIPYPTPKSVGFYRLVGSYLAGKNETFEGGLNCSPWEFVDVAKTLDKTHATEMRAFLLDFENAFGWKDCKFLKTSGFTALMRIWLDNYQHVRTDVLVKQWRAKLDNPKGKELASESGMKSCQVVHRKYLRMLNNNGQTDTWVDSEDLLTKEEAA